MRGWKPAEQARSRTKALYQDPFQRGPSRLVASSGGTGAAALKRDGNMKSLKNKTKWKSSRKMALRVKVLAPQVLQPEFGPLEPKDGRLEPTPEGGLPPSTSPR